VRARDPNDALGGEGAQRVHDVTAGGPGLVAVGGTTLDLGDGADDREAEVWTSADGNVWERVDTTGSGFSGEGNQLANVVRAGPKGLIAAGYDTLDDHDAAVWTSADGMTWSQVGDRDVLGGPYDQQIHGLTLVGSGWVAAGWTHPEEKDKNAAIWVSEDGMTWERMTDTDASLGGSGSQQVEAVAASGATIVAVGVDDVGTTGDAIVWVGQPG
jgi:hypothetical protein